jgi:glycosyltransferase involved in cell wall biosynthesis
MKIGLDARFYGPSGKGIGRYTQKLIDSLEKLDTQNEYFIFLTKEGFDLYEPKNTNFHKILANYPWYSFKEQLLLPRLLKKHQLDLMHFLHFNKPIAYRGKFVVTIHDLTLLDFSTKKTTWKKSWWWFKNIIFKIAISESIKKSEKIIVDSQFIKDELMKRFKIPNDKIKVIELAV